MPSAADLVVGDKFYGMFIGKSGSGKKAAAATYPKPMMYLDFDNRIEGLLGSPWVNREGIDYIQYFPRVNGILSDNVVSKLNKDLAKLLDDCITGKNKYKTLIWASLTGQTFQFIQEALPFTHIGKADEKTGKEKLAGRNIGGIMVSGMDDYTFEASGTYQCMSFIQALNKYIPNVIVMAHIIPRFGKSDPDDPYSPTEIIGEKLSVRDKIGAEVTSRFNHVFKFDKMRKGDNIYYTVEFNGDLARTSYAGLPNKPVDITGKNFYESLMRNVNGPNQVPQQVKAGGN